MLPSTRLMLSAYGRAASAAASARRSLDAATICIALVIFCVALVAAMRTRMSLREAIADSVYPLASADSLPRLRGRVREGANLLVRRAPTRAAVASLRRLVV